MRLFSDPNGLLCGLFFSMALAVAAIGFASANRPAEAAETERPRLYTVVNDLNLRVRWFYDGNAECYIATNDDGISGINTGVARSTSIACRWMDRP